VRRLVVCGWVDENFFQKYGETLDGLGAEGALGSC
jgi:hypothetical protein